MASLIISHTTHASIQFDSVTTTHYKLYYAYSGNPGKLGLLFVHGTPGSWQAFQSYLNNTSLQEKYFMVSVDRLGWGQSGHKYTQVVTQFNTHSQSISDILTAFPNKQWVVIAHSYGASLTPRIALDNNNQVTGLLLLAGSHNPKLGKPRWYNWLANSYLIDWILPHQLKKSNREIMALSYELEQLEKTLYQQLIRANIVIIQGMKDRLVSPRNAYYMTQKWPNQRSNLTVLELPDAGHFLPWQQTDIVIETINWLAELSASQQ